MDIDWRVALIGELFVLLFMVTGFLAGMVKLAEYIKHSKKIKISERAVK